MMKLNIKEADLRITMDEALKALEGKVEAAFGTTKDSNLMRSITGNIGTKPRSAIWTKTLKYVQGRDCKCEDVSFVIAFNKCRKEILDHLKANKKYQNILLKTFDCFKDYVLEQFIFPIQNDHSQEMINLCCAFNKLIENKTYYEELKRILGL